MLTSFQSLFPERGETILPAVTSRNELLRELLEVPGIAKDLLPQLKLASLTVNQVVYESGDKVELVYLPLDCVVSRLSITEDGTTVETSMVGREGVLGMSTILGSG